MNLSQTRHPAWGEWVETFAREVAAATEIEARGDTPPTYYEQWLVTAAAGTAPVLKAAARAPLVRA